MYKRIKNKIKKGLVRTMLTSTLLATENANIKLTDIIKKGESRFRSEIILNKSTLNSDFYVVGEGGKKNSFYKFRGQKFALKDGFFNFGLVLQHVDGTYFQEHQEIGSVVRIKRKTKNNNFIKLDARYFASKNNLDVYALINNKRLFADLIGNYNLKTNNTMLRLGIDYKINKKISIGVESKLLVNSDKIKNDYIGIRIGSNL